jgi:phosphate starvation-inducible protein PhoH
MGLMSKVRGASAQPTSEPVIRVKRKRGFLPGDQHDPFARAFVDALKDILSEEMRHTG